MKLLTNHWFIGCASSRLGEQPIRTQLGEHNLVLFRDGTGQARALVNQCCHRGMELSRGKMVEGHLECPFHGWRYDGAGKCAHIPSLYREKEIKKIYQVPSFTVQEKDGYVWIWVGDRAPSYAPSIPHFSEGRWAQGSVPIHCEAARVIEINLDITHVYFVHPTHPSTLETKRNGFRESQYEVRLTDTGLVMFGSVTANETDPVPNGGLKVAFDLPDRVLLQADIPHFGVAYIILYCIPTGPRTCRMEYIMMQFDPTKQEKLVWEDEVPQNFEEDRKALEIIQNAYDVHGTSFEKSVESDAAPLMARQVLKLAESGEWPGKRAQLGMRKVVDVRL